MLALNQPYSFIFGRVSDEDKKPYNADYWCQFYNTSFFVTEAAGKEARVFVLDSL
jgi:hypothetical protein